MSMAFVFHFPDQYWLPDEGSNSQKGSRANSHKFWWSPENCVHPHGKRFIPQVSEIQSLPESFEPAANPHPKMKRLRQLKSQVDSVECPAERSFSMVGCQQGKPLPEERGTKGSPNSSTARRMQNKNWQEHSKCESRTGRRLVPCTVESSRHMDTNCSLNYTANIGQV